MLDRGQERFNIYCAPCHGPTGDGDGMVVQRGYRQPPSFHIDRLRSAAGLLLRRDHQRLRRDAGLRAQIAPRDRWAIVAYIRALQLSQHASATRTSRRRKRGDKRGAAAGRAAAPERT